MADDRLNILWVKTGPLHPLDTGGKLRTYNMMKELRKNHRITFLTLEPDTSPDDWKDRAQEYCHEVISVPWKESIRFTAGFYLGLAINALFSRRPYAIDKYISSEMRDMISESDDGSYDLIVCDFLAPAANFPDRLETPTLIFQHNVESDIWRRHYKQRADLSISKMYFRLQWKRMSAFEKRYCGRFDGVVTVSPKDSETLRGRFNLGNILGDVPAGVDLQYFRSSGKRPSSHCGLVFTGSMDWLPNDDAVSYFIQDIYPEIKAAVPDVTLTIAGRNPSQGLLEKASEDSSILVTGTVEDIRPYVHDAAIMIVPLRIGGGTRIKIFEGMAMGIPIVSTSIGAEGLPVSHGDNILLADEPESFAREVIDLIGSEDRRKNIADAALDMVRTKYSWEAASRIFESYCFELVSATGKRRKQ
jgi:glycosyltransferase involved in cell wall biosynthesis